MKTIFFFILFFINNFSSLKKYNPTDLFEGGYEYYYDFDNNKNQNYYNVQSETNKLQFNFNNIQKIIKDKIKKIDQSHKNSNFKYWTRYNIDNDIYNDINNDINNKELLLNENVLNSKKNALQNIYNFFKNKLFQPKIENFKTFVYFEKNINNNNINNNNNEKIARKNSLLSMAIKKYYYSKMKYHHDESKKSALLLTSFIFVNFLIPFTKKKFPMQSNLKYLKSHIFGNKYIEQSPYFNKFMNSAILYFTKRNTKLFILDKYRFGQNILPQIINLFIKSKHLMYKTKIKKRFLYLSYIFLYEYLMQKRTYNELTNTFLNDYNEEKENFKKKYYSEDMDQNLFDEKLDLEINEEEINILFEKCLHEGNNLDNNECLNFIINNQNNNILCKKITYIMSSNEILQNTNFNILTHDGAYTFFKSFLLLYLNDYFQSRKYYTESEKLYFREFFLKDLNNNSFFKRLAESIDENILKKYFKQNSQINFNDYKPVGFIKEIEAIKKYLFFFSKLHLVDEKITTDLNDSLDRMSVNIIALQKILQNSESIDIKDITSDYITYIKGNIIVYNNLRVELFNAMNERKKMNNNIIPEMAFNENILYFNI